MPAADRQSKENRTRAGQVRLVQPPILAGLPNQAPTFIPPMQCRLAKSLPVGEQWRYELKLDGYRALAVRTNAGVTLLSRNRKDLSHRFRGIVEAIELLPMKEGVLDGEIVAVDGWGKPSFQALQLAGRARRPAQNILYYAFDLLNWDGKALLNLPLLERKRLLEHALVDAPTQVRLAPFLDGHPDEILAAVRRRNLEGVVAKRALSGYEPDQRSGAWVKVKCGINQEFVIGGYTRGRSNAAFGALVVGYYEGGKLRYASKVGTGFTVGQIRDIVNGTAPLQQAECPFEFIPESDGTSWSYGLTALERKTATWLQPVLVCSVKFTEWTREGHLRHPCFEGIRTDKDATEVKREEPALMLGRDLQLSRQFFPGPLAYLKASEFIPISANNFGAYTVLAKDNEFTYAVTPLQSTGFVFASGDVANPPSIGMAPVLHVELRNSAVRGYTQAHNLRIRDAYAMKGVATAWYLHYAQHSGGIALDFDHLEGGRRGWKSLVRAAEGCGLKVCLVDTTTGEQHVVSPANSAVWLQDAGIRPLVLVSK